MAFRRVAGLTFSKLSLVLSPGAALGIVSLAIIFSSPESEFADLISALSDSQRSNFTLYGLLYAAPVAGVPG